MQARNNNSLNREQLDKLVIDDYAMSGRFTVDPNTPLSDVLDIMHENHIRHLPVVTNGQVTGIISDRDIKFFDDQKYLEWHNKLTADDVMTPDPYSICMGTPLLDVINEMITHKYGSAIVCNEFGEVVGIFTTIDALKALKDILDGKIPEES